MISKIMALEDGTIDYIVVSEKEEIFINVVVDNNIILLTNVGMINTADKEMIFNGHMTVQTVEYRGMLGFFMALNSVYSYILSKVDSGEFLMSDIEDLACETTKDISYLKREAYSSLDETTRKGRKRKKFLDDIYMGRFDD